MHDADGLDRPRHDVIAVRAHRRSVQHGMVRVRGRGKAQQTGSDQTGRDRDATNAAANNSKSSIHVVSHALGCPTPPAILQKDLSRAGYGLIALVTRATNSRIAFRRVRRVRAHMTRRALATDARVCTHLDARARSQARALARARRGRLHLCVRRAPLTIAAVGPGDRGNVSATAAANADPAHRPPARPPDLHRCRMSDLWLGPIAGGNGDRAAPVTILGTQPTSRPRRALRVERRGRPNFVLGDVSNRAGCHGDRVHRARLLRAVTSARRVIRTAHSQNFGRENASRPGEVTPNCAIIRCWAARAAR
jgi:hypothetical protein